MVSLPLVKASPLSGVYQRYPVQTQTVAGWAMALHFGHPEREASHRQHQAVLADWSCIGKLMITTPRAPTLLAVLGVSEPPAHPLAPLTSSVFANLALLQLTATDSLLLCPPEQTPHLLERLRGTVPVTDVTGALACLALAGPKRGEVWERSTALELAPERAVPGAVRQTTVHMIRCTLWQMTQADLIFPARALAESLFDALLDVGLPLGLLPAGLQTLPITLPPA